LAQSTPPGKSRCVSDCTITPRPDVGALLRAVVAAEPVGVLARDEEVEGHDAATGDRLDAEEPARGLATVDGDVALVDEVVELLAAWIVELAEQRAAVAVELRVAVQQRVHGLRDGHRLLTVGRAGGDALDLRRERGLDPPTGAGGRHGGDDHRHDEQHAEGVGGV
jgi:hypothetical protein